MFSTSKLPLLLHSSQAQRTFEACKIQVIIKGPKGANYLKVGNYSNSGFTLGFWDLILH
jgi:hypothetical protein